MSDYTTRLKLDFDPFEPRAAVRGFFSGAERGELLDELLAAAVAGGQLACVSGGPGSGKTTLAQEICQRCGEEAECARIQATLFMNRSQFLDCLAAELGWLDAGQDWQLCLDTIARRAADLDLEARAIVIVVDDAHELGSEVITALAQILKRCSAGLSLLLLGEAQLRQSLPAAMQTRIAWYELSPFSSEDCLDYLRFKLATAGYVQALPLPESQLDELYAKSRGNPASLNTLIAAALTESEATVAPAGTAQQALPSLFSQGQPYWLAAGVLVVMLLGVLLFVDGGDAGNLPVTRSIPVVVNADGQVDRSAAPTQAPLPAQSPVAQDESGALAQADPEPDAPLAQSPDTAEEVAPADPAGARPGSSAAPQPAPTPAVASLPEFTRSLLDAAPEGFTIQVMGTSSQDNAQRFLATHFASADSGVIETRFQNQPWYVVVHGNFSDRAGASAAIAGLPEAVRELQPFVRSLKEIQTAVRQQLSSR